MGDVRFGNPVAHRKSLVATYGRGLRMDYFFDTLPQSRTEYTQTKRRGFMKTEFFDRLMSARAVFWFIIGMFVSVIAYIVATEGGTISPWKLLF